MHRDLSLHWNVAVWEALGEPTNLCTSLCMFDGARISVRIYNTPSDHNHLFGEQPTRNARWNGSDSIFFGYSKFHMMEFELERIFLIWFSIHLCRNVFWGERTDAFCITMIYQMIKMNEKKKLWTIQFFRKSWIGNLAFFSLMNFSVKFWSCNIFIFLLLFVNRVWQKMAPCWILI